MEETMKTRIAHRGRPDSLMAIVVSVAVTVLLWSVPSPGLTGYGGVNLACAEFGEHNLPGAYGVDYTYPTHEEVDYFVGKQMNIFRLPFRWERLQTNQFAEFDLAELARMDDFVTYANSKGATVVLDPHNYARYYGNLIGESQAPVTAFSNFWSKLATHYKNDPLVVFGLMNEPHTMSTELWVSNANVAIQAIRATGATNLILVPGNAWTGAHSWYQNWYGTPNAVAMLNIVDPGSNYAVEVHQYMDSDSSGTSADCVSQTIGSERLASFTGWCTQYGKRAFLGEFAGGRNQCCYDALDDMLAFVDSNSHVYLGWTYWAAGPWWGDYMFTLEPDNGQDRPQMAPLSNHLPIPEPGVIGWELGGALLLFLFLPREQKRRAVRYSVSESQRRHAATRGVHSETNLPRGEHAV